MAKTLTGQVVQQVIQATGRGTQVFNDKLVSGARSLKVVGWWPSDYNMARRALVQLGCQVMPVKLTLRKSQNGKSAPRRLRVTEPTA